ncbi:MAG: hypothetical protein AB2604_16895 [Candidatus Thiodiazotropha taylori]
MNRKSIIFVLAMGVSMFGFGKDKSVIEVKFYEGKSEAPFAVSNVPIEQLPDTFEIDTTMHLGEDDWRVLGAEPAEKTKFRKSGKLNLYLAKSEITQIDPNELLYSLPTISNDLAGVENAESLENVAVFREDDWRQFEFVVRNYESIIDEEFGHIKNIYENHREGVGFKQLHLREKIVTPLENTPLTLNVLGESFEIVKKYKGVAFNNTAATIIGGFAMQTESGWVLWGQVNESGKILVLNISQTRESNIVGISGKIDKFTEKHGLYLIDWPRLFWSGPGKLNFSAYGE